MRILDKHEYTIGAHFLPALFNGDVSGLDDTETAEIEQFETAARNESKRQYPDMISAHWAYDEFGEGFRRCEITGLLFDCYRASLVIMGK